MLKRCYSIVFWPAQFLKTVQFLPLYLFFFFILDLKQFGFGVAVCVLFGIYPSWDSMKVLDVYFDVFLIL